MTSIPAPETSCTCETIPDLPLEQALRTCSRHGMDLNTVEGLAALLRYAGVEIGSVNGQAFREHAATRMLPLMRQQYATIYAGAYTQGIADEQTADGFGHVASANRANPYTPTEKARA